MKRLFKVMLLKAIKRKNSNRRLKRKSKATVSLWYVPFLRPLSPRKEEPDVGGSASTHRRLLSDVLLP